MKRIICPSSLKDVKPFKLDFPIHLFWTLRIVFTHNPIKLYRQYVIVDRNMRAINEKIVSLIEANQPPRDEPRPPRPKMSLWRSLYYRAYTICATIRIAEVYMK